LDRWIVNEDSIEWLIVVPSRCAAGRLDAEADANRSTLPGDYRPPGSGTDAE
jgi:hypothetical protein